MSRRKDLEEDLDIDVLTPDDSYPRNAEPYIPPSGSIQQTGLSSAESTEESEEVRSIRLIENALKWADEGADDDTWEGFFISLDLEEKLEDEDQ